MKKQYLIITMLIFSSSLFGQTIKDISGLYGECAIGFFACEQMYLKPDGTFSYFLFYDVGGGNVSEGKWQYKYDTLYLTTFKKPKQPNPYIINTEFKNSDSLQIHVYDYDSTKLGFAHIVINDTIRQNCDENGCAKIPNMPIYRILVNYISESYTYNLKDINVKDVSLFIPFAHSTQSDYFIDEKWLYKKNKLIRYNRIKQKYDIKYPLPKTDLSNKRF
jgi:hypothetical protein